MAQEDAKRTYLVVVDDSEEARVALRFAARRAAKTNGRIEVLGIVEPQEFVQFGGVQSAIEEEQRLADRGRRQRRRSAKSSTSSGVEAQIVVRQGEAVQTVRESIGEREDVAALVLGAAASGDPGPLVGDFAGADAGRLPCPLMIIPGSLSEERLEQLS